MIRKFSGTPGELHALDPFALDGAYRSDGRLPALWECEPTSSAMVLGSRQSLDVVDSEACRTAGFSVARRRSGGGAVLIVPDDIVWIDVVAPQGVFSDDVRASMIAVGECWQQALVDGGVDPSQLSCASRRDGRLGMVGAGVFCRSGARRGVARRQKARWVEPTSNAARCESAGFAPPSQ